MNKQKVLEWILDWIDEHTDQENPEDILDLRTLRS
jgi:hypothetical protein